MVIDVGLYGRRYLPLDLCVKEGADARSQCCRFGVAAPVEIVEPLGKLNECHNRPRIAANSV